MCGIAGIIQPYPRFTLDEVKKMTDAIAHRGPDGEGFWKNATASCILGHRRMAIIDLSAAAAQPLHYRQRYSIVYNGEIYNYIELRKELQNEGYLFHTQGDTEIILAAYDHWEEDCVDHFDGMFAFAIWDEQEKELFAARDRFGEKPFFYSTHLGGFHFASEMKALWAAGIPREPNLKMLFNFITIGYTGNPEEPSETFYEHILKLPAASRLYYTPADNTLVIEKYWELDADEQYSEVDTKSTTEQFLHLLTASVKRRLRSDVPLGTSLSGGLDSSAIASIIRDLHPDRPYAAFTAGFPGYEKSELEYAAAVAGRLSIRQHTVMVTGEDLSAQWKTFMHHQEEPVGSASAFAQFKVAELAKQHHITVLLDGQGADETLAGYHKYYKWYWQELFVRRKLMRSGEIRATQALGINEQFGLKNVMASLFPDLAAVILEHQYLMHALRHEELEPSFIKLHSKEAYYTTPELRNLNGALHFNTCTHGLEELLRYADRNSMSFAREVRLPFLSHELVEFIFKLPSSHKIRDGWTKRILRDAMSGKLPDHITWRKDKTGFEPPQHKWMKQDRLAAMINEARQKLVDHRILRPEVLLRPVQPSDAYSAGQYDWRYFAAAGCL